MVCKLIQTELIGYELGTIDEGGRTSVESHLVECRECLAAYLRLKRHLATGATSTERPSGAVRARLREAVAESFRPSLGHRIRRWALRPVPLYQSLATAAVAAALAIATPTLLRNRPSLHMAPGVDAEHVDTSRNRPENLTLY